MQRVDFTTRCCLTIELVKSFCFQFFILFLFLIVVSGVSAML